MYRRPSDTRLLLHLWQHLFEQQSEPARFLLLRLWLWGPPCEPGGDKLNLELWSDVGSVDAVRAKRTKSSRVLSAKTECV